MHKNENSIYLTAAQSLATSRNGMNQQIANARWQFISAVRKKVPKVFEQLRDSVLPAFEQFVRPGYWKTGYSFSMWQSRSDPDGTLTAVLMDWARQFHLQKEIWILEGALQTLSTWHRFPKTR